MVVNDKNWHLITRPQKLKHTKERIKNYLIVLLYCEVNDNYYAPPAAKAKRLHVILEYMENIRVIIGDLLCYTTQFYVRKECTY